MGYMGSVKRAQSVRASKYTPARQFLSQKDVEAAAEVEQRRRVQARQQAMAHARAQARARSQRKVIEQARSSFSAAAAAVVGSPEDWPEATAAPQELLPGGSPSQIQSDGPGAQIQPAGGTPHRPVRKRLTASPATSAAACVGTANGGTSYSHSSSSSGGNTGNIGSTDGAGRAGDGSAGSGAAATCSSPSPSTEMESQIMAKSRGAVARGTDGSGSTVAWELMIRHEELTLDEDSDLIGRGGTGTVYRAEWCGTPVAVKKIFYGAGHEEDLASLKKEANILSSLRHPHIVLFLGASFAPPNIFVVSELVIGAGGHRNMRQVLDDKLLTATLSLALRLRMACDIAMACHYLHSRGIIHRDLKSANVLVTDSMRCKVADFGMSRIIGTDQRAKNARQTDLAGRRVRRLNRPLTMRFNFGGWIAPEVIDGKEYSKAVDVFSYGILLCEVISGLQVEELPRQDGEQFAHVSQCTADLLQLRRVWLCAPCFRRLNFFRADGDRCRGRTRGQGGAAAVCGGAASGRR